MEQHYLEWAALLISLLPVLCLKKWRDAIWLSAAIGFVCNFLFVLVITNLFIKSVVANVYLWVDFILICLIYRRHMVFKHFRWMKLIAIVLFAAEITNTFFMNRNAGQPVSSSSNSLPVFLQHLGQFNGAGAACFSAFYILSGFFGYLLIIRQRVHLYLEQSVFFWYNTALFIYSSGVFILFLSINYFVKEHKADLIAKLWFVNNSLVIIKSILVFIALSRKDEDKRGRHLPLP